MTEKKLKQKVYCSDCKRKTNHQIILTHEEHSTDEHDIAWHAYYHIVRCMGCDRIAFVEQYGDEDQWDFNAFGEMEWYDTFTVYPEEPKEDLEEKIKRKFQLSPKSFKNMPNNLYTLYTQIIDSYNMQHNILCAAGLRTLIEGICLELGVESGCLYEKDGTKKKNKKGEEIKTNNLEGKIFGLYEKSYIIFDQALILQKVRLIGNNAVHVIIEPESRTLKQIINIIENVIYNIYELKNHELLQDK
ncbi:DUF4145 domain-containing protein [Aeribacillus composti]|uniref:DUF4145 domain-containing protein n=1 Tax=Aeribacillus composti TaxID=1868734 RepID=UPI002E1B131D|nr:hypothetical protein [Aeribacillus composti]